MSYIYRSKRKGEKMYKQNEKPITTVSEIIKTYKVNVNSNIDIAIKANQGIDAHSFFEMAKVTGYTKDELAKVLSTSVKTFSRYEKENKKLGPLRSELILKIMALFQKGIDLFGELTHFKNWLAKPAFGLGNQQPFDLIQTSTGIDLVLDELTRIEYGDLA